METWEKENILDYISHIERRLHDIHETFNDKDVEEYDNVANQIIFHVNELTLAKQSYEQILFKENIIGEKMKYLMQYMKQKIRIRNDEIIRMDIILPYTISIDRINTIEFINLFKNKVNQIVEDNEYYVIPNTGNFLKQYLINFTNEYMNQKIYMLSCFQGYDNNEETFYNIGFFNEINNRILRSMIYYTLQNIFSEGFEDVKITLEENQLNIISKPINTIDQDTKCGICLSIVSSSTNNRLLKCNHIFHKECIDKWLTEYSVKCILCRKDMREFI